MTLDRALPGRYIDLIRDGVKPKDLRAQGDRAVWTALVRISASAQQRGWDAWELHPLIADDPRSNLGRQIRFRATGQPRKAKAVQDLLDGSWEKAWEWRTGRPDALTSEEVGDEACVERPSSSASCRTPTRT